MTPWQQVVERAAPAWRPLSDEEDRAVWPEFEHRFTFRPSVNADQWPGIAEPADSRTYAVGWAYGDEGEYTRLTMDLCEKLHAALRRCVASNEAIWVLDWQHPAYRFSPHEPFRYASEDDWPVPAFPNGDYHIFLAPDLRFGVFGHPWEQTICVFGRTLLEAFDADKPALFATSIRIGGRAV